jgi:cyclic pyranopterin phosphate synthase
MDLSDRCRRDSIEFGFDCGFPMCIFSDAEIGRLYKNKVRLLFVCEPVIDIDPDLNVIYCYPLSGFKTLKLKNFESVSQIYKQFEALMANHEGKKGIYDQCQKCPYRANQRCGGGCRGHYISA